MNVKEVPIPSRFKDLFTDEGIGKLYPPQESLAKSQGMNGKNLVLATPTASGKTFASELLMAKTLGQGKQVVYVVPLRALASEKHQEFRKYESLGYRVRVEMGDLDSSHVRQMDFDILVTTAEKCDSILRSKPSWFKDVGLLILDEVHLISTGRGPVYEILVAKFRKQFPNVQILALSATIGNPEELSSWLDAELIFSEWRPVNLSEHIVVGADKNRKLAEVVDESLIEDGQVLVFVRSRRSAESAAEKLGKRLDLLQGKDVELNGLADKVLHAMGTPTEQCKRLSSCVNQGAAFHHAGIVNKQRNLIEEAFKEGILKVIVATPTLAAGVNLPSRTVVVRDLTRFTSRGPAEIPVLEYKQQAGRAGRPKYDDQGVAFAIAKNESQASYFEEKYLHGNPEDIHSRLGSEPVLRSHVLACIASRFTRDRRELQDFFASTFFGHQYGFSELKGVIEDILDKLLYWNFIQPIEGDTASILPTQIGKRVSQLYIDPYTAHNYLDLMQEAEQKSHFPALGLLEMLCDSTEIPLLYVKRKEESSLWEDAMENADDLLRNVMGFELGFDFLERYKTARILNLWIQEATENYMYREMNIPPGVLYQRLKVSEWLSYAATELAKINKMEGSMGALSDLQLRIRHGVKEELLPLVRIKGIGRVRARRLFKQGIKTPGDLLDTDKETLSQLLGKKTASKVRTEAKLL